MVQVVEQLPNKCVAPSSNSSTAKKSQEREMRLLASANSGWTRMPLSSPSTLFPFPKVAHPHAYCPRASPLPQNSCLHTDAPQRQVDPLATAGRKQPRFTHKTPQKTFRKDKRVINIRGKNWMAEQTGTRASTLRYWIRPFLCIFSRIQI
jgi:hypothetical protein